MKHRDSRAPAPAQDWLPGLPFAGMGKDEKGLRESRLPRTPPPGPRAVSRGAREKPADRARAQMHLSLSTPLTRRVFPRPSSRRLLDGFSTSEEEDQAARPPPPSLLLPLPVSLLYTPSSRPAAAARDAGEEAGEEAEEVEVGVLPSGASPSHTRRPENPKI
mgnify:CR=1 FL=1